MNSKYKTLIAIIGLTLLITHNVDASKYLDPNEDTVTEQQPRKIDEVLKELKEERKAIEQQKLLELEQKKLEKENELKKNGNTIIEDAPKESTEKSKVNENYEIPKLIVRLRGKHSTKYLCEYTLLINNDDIEKELHKEIITDYNVLYKKPSLKVRPGESINFEFQPNSKDIKAYLYNESFSEIKVKRGTIIVPQVDEKIVVLIDGKFENGIMRYAIVLDVRSE